MTDLNRPPLTATADLIELLFFAYRDFIADPDHVLARFGFGRAHHRVLHFVYRHPGLRVADLLDILKITKQSLGRVLRDLVAQGYVSQREGEVDRRERLLFLTRKGEQLAAELLELQNGRFRRALATEGCPDRDAAARLFYALISPDNRAPVARLVGRSSNSV